MKRVIVVGLALVALVAASAAAQQPVEYNVTVQGEIVKGAAGDHFLTFDGPCQIPEVSLPAGTYVLTIVAPSIVRVSSADRTQYYAMFQTIPARRTDANEEYEMVFARTNRDAPQRIAQWFLPNQLTGLEFMYPKAETSAR